MARLVPEVIPIRWIAGAVLLVPGSFHLFQQRICSVVAIRLMGTGSWKMRAFLLEHVISDSAIHTRLSGVLAGGGGGGHTDLEILVQKQET